MLKSLYILIERHRINLIINNRHLIKINKLSNKLNYKKVKFYKILKKINKINYKLNFLKYLNKTS